tara:strand:+ start:1341 stop:2384 length:1044 start_codon:yes stop_codon:yes gene_type:complete
MLIFIIIILILVLVIYKDRHLFWDAQPMMAKYETGIKIINVIPNFKIKFPNNAYMLKLNDDIDSVFTFLNINYKNNYNINYNYFTRRYTSDGAQNITMYHNKNIIGFVQSIPTTVHYNGMVLEFNYIDYLMVDPSFKHKNISSILLGSIFNSYNNKKSIILFKKINERLPCQHIIKTQMYYKSLLSVLPVKIENIYNLRDEPLEIDNIFNYYGRLMERYSVRTYTDSALFAATYISTSEESIYVINNTNGYKTLVIGKKNIYKTANNIYNCFDIDLIVGELKYSEYINKTLSNILKQHGYDYYNITNIAHMSKYIKDVSMNTVKDLYYYVYNLASPEVPLSQFAFSS